jgi:soluble lytic murein transglycosylase
MDVRGALVRSQMEQEGLAVAVQAEPAENARALLLEKKPKTVHNHIGRAYGILANAHSITSKESMNLLSLMRLGGIEYLNENYEGAAAVFEEYRSLHPTGRRIGQAKYWAARSYLALGRDEDARAVLRRLREVEPLSYYGIRAGELLDQPALAIPMEAEPGRVARTDSLVRQALRRVDVLAELDRREELVHEVERLRAHFAREDGGDYALAEALNKRGYTLTGIGIGWDIHRREGAWNPRLLRIIYPFPFQELVLPESRERGLDPYLVAAVIRRESAFNPTVTSHAGAIGLMQIMPATGRGLAQGAGIRRFNVEHLRQPELNVHLGVRYLDHLARQYDGELHLVLSAYNAGPARANRWRQMPEIRDAELFAERIPFAETRDYVKKVMANAVYYAAVLDKKPVPLKARLGVIQPPGASEPPVFEEEAR